MRLRVNEGSELETAYGVVLMKLEDREEINDCEEYYDRFYNISAEEMTEIFMEMTGNSEALTAQTAFNAFMIAYEIGRTHGDVRRDLHNE